MRPFHFNSVKPLFLNHTFLFMHVTFLFMHVTKYAIFIYCYCYSPTAMKSPRMSQLQQSLTPQETICEVQHFPECLSVCLPITSIIITLFHHFSPCCILSWSVCLCALDHNSGTETSPDG